MIPPIVDADFLAARRGDVVLADVRWYLDGRSGRLAYEQGHLPGAVFVDLDRSLAGAPGPDTGRHPLPEPKSFAEAMAASGIGDGDLVVAYDDAGGVTAARLVWMLRSLDRDAALLDGGLGAFGSASGAFGSASDADGPASGTPLERGIVQPAPKTFTERPWPADRLAGIEDALDPANVVIDARPRERFRGDEEPVDRQAGHIPGARNVPCREHLDGHGRLLAAELLRRRFAEAGIADAATPVVSYCGSGVTACHNLLVLEHLGLGRARLYPGSWSQYSAREDLPIETGDGSLRRT